MMKPAVTVALLALPLFATPAVADTVTTEVDTLVVVTPNAPIVVTQGAASQAPGAAEMPPPPAARPVMASAPQNEAWTDVSHINGVPVKVGERGDYLFKQRKTNISGNPFGPFFGYYDIAVSHALSQNLAASVAITGWDLDDGGYTQGYQVSATVPLYFRRTYSGPYLEGGLLLRTDTSNDYAYDEYGYESSYETMDSTSWIGPQLLFGWHATFDSGLNVALAFGVAKHLNGDKQTDGNGYFRVGYAF